MWKTIEEFPQYEASDVGEIRNKNTGYIRKQYLHKGYFHLILCGKKVATHRLIAKAFISNPDDKPQVNHIDGNKKNNLVSNLEWVTPKENNAHAARLGLNNTTGENNKKAKLKQVQANWIRNHKHIPTKDLAKLFNVSPAAISLIKHNKTYRA